MDLNPGPPVKAVTALPVLQPPEKNRTKELKAAPGSSPMHTIYALIIYSIVEIIHLFRVLVFT